MRLIFQVFRKDIRRLTAPIVALLIIHATATVVEIERHWPVQPRSINRIDWSPSVLPITWLFLIAAVLLQERLPGTTQYWLTRPIGWPKLLAAKLIFVALFINAAWFLSDCVILSSLHLAIHPLALLYHQVPLSLTLLLPAFCLASLCTGVGQFALGLVVAVVVFVIDLLFNFFRSSIGGVAGGIGESSAVDFDIQYSPVAWPLIALPALTLFIIGFQFARRFTSPSRLALLIPIFSLIPFTLFPTMDLFSMHQRVRMFGDKPDPGPSSLKFSFDFESSRKPVVVERSYYNNLQLPVRIEGLPKDVFVEGLGNAYLNGLQTRLSTNLYNDDNGYWLRIWNADSKVNFVPSMTVDVTASLHIAVFKIEKTQLIPLSNPGLFSPQPGTFCRSGPTTQNVLQCWSGPGQSSDEQYRAFTWLGHSSVELHSSPRENPWAFSPIMSWTLYPFGRASSEALPGLSPEAVVRVLTLRPLAEFNRTLPTQKIDPGPYRFTP